MTAGATGLALPCETYFKGYFKDYSARDGAAKRHFFEAGAPSVNYRDWLTSRGKGAGKRERRNSPAVYGKFYFERRG